MSGAPGARAGGGTRRRRGRARALLAAAGSLALAAPAGCGDPGPTRATLSVAATLADTDTAGYARALAPRSFRFPADHGPHPSFKHEWWYFTGNLATAQGRPFGFQLTVFRSALRPDPVTVASPWATRQAYMGHFAVTDVAGGTFHAYERFERGALGLAGARAAPVRVWIGDWEVSGGREASPAPSGGGAAVGPGPVFRIEAAEGPVALDLHLGALKPVVLQGDGGLSAKGPEPGNASYYYSLTRLGAAGTVTVGGATHRVEGLAWLDREWSTSALSPGIVGWDWFALQLDDGSDLMVYRLRREDGTSAPASAGTFVAADGSVTRLDADDWALEATGSWPSPRGGRYPAGWLLRVPGLDLELTVEPRLPDQELDLAFRYWEGAVAARGRRKGGAVAGIGYVELTGYAGRPPAAGVGGR